MEDRIQNDIEFTEEELKYLTLLFEKFSEHSNCFYGNHQFTGHFGFAERDRTFLKRFTWRVRGFLSYVAECVRSY